MIGTGNGERMAWWRDCALYFLIPAGVAWQGAGFEVSVKALGGSVIAGAIAWKAKLSNGKPKNGESESQLVTIDNSKKQPVPVEDVGGKK